MRASAPVGVFSSHECLSYPVPADRGACDHVETQLPPTDALGRDFVLVPSPDWRGEERATYWRLTAADDASIRVHGAGSDQEADRPAGTSVPSCPVDAHDRGAFGLSRGETCEFAARSVVTIESDARLLVVGITANTPFGTGPPEVLGDAAMWVVEPVEEFGGAATFVVPAGYDAELSVVYQAGEDPRLDGRELRPGDPVAGGSFAVSRTPIDRGRHSVSAESPMSVRVVGVAETVGIGFTPRTTD